MDTNMSSPVASDYQTISTSHPLFTISTFERIGHSPDLVDVLEVGLVKY
jgi:hypothetical protein